MELTLSTQGFAAAHVFLRYLWLPLRQFTHDLHSINTDKIAHHSNKPAGMLGCRQFGSFVQSAVKQELIAVFVTHCL